VSVRVGIRGIVQGVVLVTLAASPAAAHVDVLPAEAVVNTAQEFVLRVPVEREVATTGVRVTFPKQLVVVRFATTPGWSRRTVAAADGSIAGVVYRGGRAGRDEYAEFRLIATPIETGTASWKVEQTSADGLVKPWTGPPEKEGATSESGPSQPGPAPVTRFVATASAVAAAATSGSDDSSPAGIWLGVIAIVIAGAGLAATGFLWSTRPMALPPDGPDDALPEAAPEPKAQPVAKSRPAPKRRRG
jgi:Domain of unkown function (DUF1775)